MAIYDGPIIDAHIHLFDPDRPQGIPWPYVGDPLCRPTLPQHYRPFAEAHHIQGAIVVEASPWRGDNDWLLETIRNTPAMLGFVGNIDPLAYDSAQALASDLAQWTDEPRFLGLRYGNLWERDLLEALSQPVFIDAMQTLARSGRTLDSANPDPRLIRALLQLSDAVPELTLVIDHLPNAALSPSDTQDFERDLVELAQRPQVFVKLSEIPQRVGAHVQLDAAHYQDGFDRLWQLFGEDRVLFGSDWPNSEPLASFDATLHLVKQLMANKSPVANAKFFAHNATLAYPLIHP